MDLLPSTPIYKPGEAAERVLSAQVDITELIPTSAIAAAGTKQQEYALRNIPLVLEALRKSLADAQVSVAAQLAVLVGQIASLPRSVHAFHHGSYAGESIYIVSETAPSVAPVGAVWFVVAGATQAVDGMALDSHVYSHSSNQPDSVVVVSSTAPTVVYDGMCWVVDGTAPAPTNLQLGHCASHGSGAGDEVVHVGSDAPSDAWNGKVWCLWQ